VQFVGINARNLHDFSMNDRLFGELRRLVPEGVPCIAESGIERASDIPQGADGWLVGTSILRHPFPRMKVKELSGRPLLKLCGIRDEQIARLCEQRGVDMIGLNFVPRSRRKVTTAQAKRIRKVCKLTCVVGVFENQPPDEVDAIVRELQLDAVQLSGDEKVTDYTSIAPVIATRTVNDKPRLGAFMYIIDNKHGGSGVQFDHSILSTFEPSLVAGGIDLAAARRLLKTVRPLGIDIASGIERAGSVHPDLVTAFSDCVGSVRYTFTS
jgi:phosphoribosylanthranilate isomerase